MAARRLARFFGRLHLVGKADGIVPLFTITSILKIMAMPTEYKSHLDSLPISMI